MIHPPAEFILVRHRMRGDVLLTSAVIRGLHLAHPGSKIYVRTLFPELFERNPRVVRAGPGECGTNTCEVFNLDAVHYEAMQGWHLIDAFASPAGFPRGGCPKTVEFYCGPDDDAWVRANIPDPIRRQGFVVAAPGPGMWAGRNWPESHWQHLCKQLLQNGTCVVLVGTHQENGGPPAYNLPCTLDLRGKTPRFSYLAATIYTADAFVGIDSFPCHVAGAMRTPRTVLFGITSPELILCDAPNTTAVCSAPGHPYTGMRHKVNSFLQIDVNGGRNPMDTIMPEAVLQAVQQSLSSLPS